MNNLKRIRLERGLSQSQLAKISNVNIRSIQLYEQAQMDINKAQSIKVYKLSKALKVKMENLLELEKK